MKKKSLNTGGMEENNMADIGPMKNEDLEDTEEELEGIDGAEPDADDLEESDDDDDTISGDGEDTW